MELEHLFDMQKAQAQSPSLPVKESQLEDGMKGGSLKRPWRLA